MASEILAAYKHQRNPFRIDRRYQAREKRSKEGACKMNEDIRKSMRVIHALRKVVKDSGVECTVDIHTIYTPLFVDRTIYIDVLRSTLHSNFLLYLNDLFGSYVFMADPEGDLAEAYFNIAVHTETSDRK
jgi:hypothetical protein